jgi:hypothetical protein
MGSFTTTIENYPYPYVIGKLCWEFPAMVPSDWEAFNLHGSTNAITLADWKAALDIAVIKQGVMPIVFHPHGWSSSAQFVEFIDYAVAKHGRKVKFLTFREAQERIGAPLGLDFEKDLLPAFEGRITFFTWIAKPARINSGSNLLGMKLVDPDAFAKTLDKVVEKFADRLEKTAFGGVMLQADLEDEQRDRNGIYAVAERLNAAGAVRHGRLLCGQP